MIYRVRNPKVASAEKLVYLPNCKSANLLQRYTLERKRAACPNWLPSLPRDIKGVLAYILLELLVCLSAVLLASILGASDDQLPVVAMAALIGITAIQLSIEWYRNWANQFNYLLELSPTIGVPVTEMISLQILRQLDTETFDRAAEEMSTAYSGIYNLAHRLSRALDDYVEQTRPIAKRCYYDKISPDTPKIEVEALYGQMFSHLQPLAEDCLNFMRGELAFYEVEMIYM